MRSLRIVGIFLSTVAVFIAFNWVLNTLMPLNRLNSLQPSKVEVITQEMLGTAALLECYVSPKWTRNNSNLLLDCDGSQMRVQKAPNDIKNLSSKVTVPGQKKVIAVSDPVVVIGKVASSSLDKDSLGKDSNAIEAELLAYGNRSTNLSAFQASGVLQIISAEVIGFFGILLLFTDWRMSRARRARKRAEAWQAEKNYATADEPIAEQSTYQSKYQPKR